MEMLVDPQKASDLRIARRRLPHWRLEGSAYFITFRLRSGELTAAERQLVKEHIRSGHRRYYTLMAVVIMPDHVHLILRPDLGYDLSRIMQGIKGASANRVNRTRGRMGTLWQDESYDRIIRDAEEYQEKLDYMLNNPTKAGLCGPEDTYDGWLYMPDLE
jgi:REP element-mobilizing transposase RayT